VIESCCCTGFETSSALTCLSGEPDSEGPDFVAWWKWDGEGVEWAGAEEEKGNGSGVRACARIKPVGRDASRVLLS
jgi:hypothetical protein